MNVQDDFWYDGDRYVARINGSWLEDGKGIFLGEFPTYDEALSEISNWWGNRGVEIEDPRKFTARTECHVGEKGSRVGDTCRAMITKKKEEENFPATF